MPGEDPFGRKPKQPGPVSEQTDVNAAGHYGEVYEVDYIRNHRWTKRGGRWRKEYQIVWKDWGVHDDLSWYPEADLLDDAKEAFEEYENSLSPEEKLNPDERKRQGRESAEGTAASLLPPDEGEVYLIPFADDA